MYQVRARLVEAKLESDSDIHLVIRDRASSGMMIVELPAPGCTSGATAGARTRMRSARNAFVAACGMPSDVSFEPLTGKTTIRGVGFFDFLHGAEWSRAERDRAAPGHPRHERDLRELVGRARVESLSTDELRIVLLIGAAEYPLTAVQAAQVEATIRERCPDECGLPHDAPACLQVADVLAEDLAAGISPEAIELGRSHIEGLYKCVLVDGGLALPDLREAVQRYCEG